MRRHEILNGICQPRLIGRQSENRSYHFVHHGPARAFKMIEIRTLLRIEREKAVIKKWSDVFPCLHDRFKGALQGFDRSEEHTSELQSLMRISYAVFCLKKKTKKKY